MSLEKKNKIFWRYAMQKKACMYDIRLTPRVRYNVGTETCMSNRGPVTATPGL
jgi:hypothetical protein